MRGVYTVSFDQQSFLATSGDYDFFELTAATDKPIEIAAIEFGDKTDIGDLNEEQIAWAVVRGNTTTGNGTTTTAQPTDPNDVAASFSAKTVGSTPASAGTPITLEPNTFNARAGLMTIYPEIMRHKTTAAAGKLCVRLTTALVRDATLSGTVWVREL